ncbi:hypothetical protein [Paenibacillus chitinolyticus]|uniref:hypothetical protein n=1 Tax=Paenibacillus chitinolyticus TaxID=79263 RepID=UPI00364DAAC5
MTTDFGKVSGDYAKYRDALPDLLFRQLKARGTDFEGRKGPLRILKENGIVLKPAGSNAEVRERRNGFPVNWFEEWERHGFRLRHEWEQAYTLAYTHEDWCGKIRTVSWLANESKELRMKVSGELLRNLSDFDAIMTIPHKYSVAVLTLES